MRIAVLLLGAVLALASAFATPSAAPAFSAEGRASTDSCAPSTHGLVQHEVTYLKEIVSDADAARRSLYALPALPTDSVALVQDPAICLQAASEYTRGLRGDTATLMLPIMVIRVGPRFVVADHLMRDSTSHHALVRVIFDSTWTPIVIVRS